jgi:hypothetical protein
MSTSIRLLVLLTIPLVAGSSRPALSQNPLGYIKHGSLFPTVTFTFSPWSASPPYYSISVDSTGNATYHSTPNSDQQTGDPYMVKFVASNPTRQKVPNLGGLAFFQTVYQGLHPC